MDAINRREFMSRAAAVMAASVATRVWAEPATRPATDTRPAQTRPAGKGFRLANDQVVLGKTGIKASRLAIGTGTHSGNDQRAAGEDNMIKLLRTELDEGIRWWDAADMYRSHPYVGRALKEVKRDRVTLTSKTMAKTAEAVKADIERFRKELNTDYIDICLLHCMTDGKWPEKMKGPMDALSEAKEKGYVRAVGCSCHTFEALQAAADEPWVEIDLARINPHGVMMDIGKPEDVPKVDALLRKMHERGKVIYGMKIVGEGTFKGKQIDKSLEYALSRPYLSGFTIGFNSKAQIDDIAKRIERIQAPV